MPNVIWDEDLEEIQNLIDEVRALVCPLRDELGKKLARMEKLLKMVEEN